MASRSGCGPVDHMHRVIFGHSRSLRKDPSLDSRVCQLSNRGLVLVKGEGVQTCNDVDWLQSLELFETDKSNDENDR